MRPRHWKKSPHVMMFLTVPTGTFQFNYTSISKLRLRGFGYAKFLVFIAKFVSRKYPFVCMIWFPWALDTWTLLYDQELRIPKITKPYFWNAWIVGKKNPNSIFRDLNFKMRILWKITVIKGCRIYFCKFSHLVYSNPLTNVREKVISLRVDLVSKNCNEAHWLVQPIPLYRLCQKKIYNLVLNI